MPSLKNCKNCIWSDFQPSGRLRCFRHNSYPFPEDAYSCGDFELQKIRLDVSPAAPTLGTQTRSRRCHSKPERTPFRAKQERSRRYYSKPDPEQDWFYNDRSIRYHSGMVLIHRRMMMYIAGIIFLLAVMYAAEMLSNTAPDWFGRSIETMKQSIRHYIGF